MVIRLEAPPKEVSPSNSLNEESFRESIKNKSTSTPHKNKEEDEEIETLEGNCRVFGFVLKNWETVLGEISMSLVY